MSKRTPIENCHFSFLCSRTWESLLQIEDHPQIRYCDRCDHSVHLCTHDDFIEHVQKGHCVALVQEGNDQNEEPGKRKLLGLIDLHRIDPVE